MIVLKPKVSARALTKEKIDEIMGSEGKLTERAWDYDYHYWVTDSVCVFLYENHEIGIDDKIEFLDEMPSTMSQFRSGVVGLIMAYRETRRLVREFADYGYMEMD